MNIFCEADFESSGTDAQNKTLEAFETSLINKTAEKVVIDSVQPDSKLADIVDDLEKEFGPLYNESKEDLGYVQLN